MKFEIKILDKPFKDNIKMPFDKEIITETQQTAEIIFLDDDESTEKVITYGYKPPEEIQYAIDHQESLDLNGCFIQNINFKDCALQSMQACNSFFYENVDFEGTIFNGNADFRMATFSGNVTFSAAEFNGVADFMLATFSGIADFSHVKVNNIANFGGTTFSDYVEFNKAIFNSDADFMEAIFSRGVDFALATFSGEAYFPAVKFCDEAYFRGVAFSNNVDFSEATFSSHATFWEATFSGKVTFSGVTFSGEVDFRDVIINNTIQFPSVKFLSYANFDFLKCYSLIIDNCVFEKASTVSSGLGFVSVAIHNCNTTSQFSFQFDDNLKHAIQHQQNTDTSTPKQSYKVLAQQFNFLKVCYNRNGEYEEEDQVYVEYKRCLRKNKNAFYRFLEWAFYDGCCGYLTKPKRVILVAFVTMIVFTGLFLIPGVLIIEPSMQDSILTLGQKAWNSIYHSVITFFTIGYGNTTPSGWWGLFFTGLEGFLGVFLMALFTVSVAHKMLR